MIERGALRFNCCESVLIRINKECMLPGFGPVIMAATSNLGGGVAGWGSACGAVTGAVIAFGLAIGTKGDETPEKFKAKRYQMRDTTQIFLKEFNEKWGHVDCKGLLGVDRRTEEGKAKYDKLKANGQVHCEEYVEWSANKAIELLNYQA